MLGDEYVKAEFRAHRGVDNPIHIVSTAEGEERGRCRGEGGEKEGRRRLRGWEGREMEGGR